MKDKITEILYNHFGWQRKSSIEKATDEIESLIKENYVGKEFEIWKDTIIKSSMIMGEHKYYNIDDGKNFYTIDDGKNFYTIEGLHEFWLTNIKNK